MKRDYLAWAALLAALCVTASGEYQLARACGFGVYVAAGVPAALDVYAVRAMRAGRDVLVVVLAMIAVNAMAHLSSAGLVPVSVPLVVAVSAIAPLVLWRVHSLGKDAEPALDERVIEPSSVDVVHEVPAELAPEPVSVERVTERAETPADLPEFPILGPMVPVAELLAGTGCDLAFPVRTADPEPAEPTPGTGGTGSSSGEVPAGVAVEHVTAAREWLTAHPELSGTAIGTRLGKSDGYGRRVKRAALAVTG